MPERDEEMETPKRRSDLVVGEEAVQLVAQGQCSRIVVDRAGIDDFPTNIENVRTVIDLAESDEKREVFPDLISMTCDLLFLFDHVESHQSVIAVHRHQSCCNVIKI